MGAGRRVAQDFDQPALDLVGDDVLPAVGFGVDLVPGQADDVGQKSFRQAVLAYDAGGQAAAGRGEGKRASPDLYVALLPQAVNHLGDGGGGVADALGQTGLDHLAALFLQVEDRLEVLLVGRVGAGPAGNIAHGPSVVLRRRPMEAPRPSRGRRLAPGVRQTLGVQRRLTGARTPGKDRSWLC